MYNKERKKRQKNTVIIPQKREPKYYTKFRIETAKIDLEELTEKEFISKASEYFYEELIYKKYFETGELFSLNKNSSYKEIQKLNLLLDELKINNFDSPRVIFFQSPPMIGISYIIRYFNKNNFKFFQFNHTFGIDNKTIYKKYLNNNELYSGDYKDGSIRIIYQKLFDIMEGRTGNEDNKTYFIVLKNLPYELFLMALKDNNYTPGFIKNWKTTILDFFKEILILLDKDKTNVKLIFMTDDKEIDEFELKTIFPTKIIDHFLTKNIICNPIPQRKMKDILYLFLNSIAPQIIEESNISSFIDSMYLEFNTNLQQILDHLLLKISSEYYHSKKKIPQLTKYNKSQTQKGKKKIKEYKESQNNKNIIKVNNNNLQIKKEQILDHDLFRLLGKLLYNKRYVIKNNSIQKLKKEEFGNIFETPRYYDINELINDIPISNNSFNDLLVYNSLDHFNDIKEYSDTLDLYSYTDTIDNFDSFIYDKNNHYFHNNNYMKTYLNCLAVTTYNLSQYNKKNNFNKFLSDKGLMTIRKPDIKINKNINKFSDMMYFKACEHYPCLISISLWSFYKEKYNIIYKLKFNNEIDNKKTSNMNNNINNKENINRYYKEKMNKKFLEENEKNGLNIENNNIYNNNNSPKSIKFRNIPEEDQNAMESFFQNCDDNDNDSETDSIIEE